MSIINFIKKKLFPFKRKNMKVGVSYNVFDGEELLEFSIKSIRKKVKYVNVVYQMTSNFGNNANSDLKKTLEKLKKEGLVDELYNYEPDFKLNPHENEKRKRDIGLKLAKKQGCNYFISMDVDEFYDEKQFNAALDYIVLNNIKTSAVSSIEYLKEPENQLLGGYTFTPKETEFYDFYFPFIIKINRFTKQKHGKGYFPCYTDPTRNLFHKGRFKLFSMQEIVLHHMSTVRKDLNKKYNNSNLLNSPKETQNHVRTIQKDILAFDFEKGRKLPDDCSIFAGKLVKKVPNKYKIEF